MYEIIQNELLTVAFFHFKERCQLCRIHRRLQLLCIGKPADHIAVFCNVFAEIVSECFIVDNVIGQEAQKIPCCDLAGFMSGMLIIQHIEQRCIEVKFPLAVIAQILRKIVDRINHISSIVLLSEGIGIVGDTFDVLTLFEGFCDFCHGVIVLILIQHHNRALCREHICDHIR